MSETDYATLMERLNAKTIVTYKPNDTGGVSMMPDYDPDCREAVAVIRALLKERGELRTMLVLCSPIASTEGTLAQRLRAAIDDNILATRERCARIAEDFAAIEKSYSVWPATEGRREAILFAAEHIAAAIRTQAAPE